MYSYLSNVTPDYIGETLDITPHNDMTSAGSKSQVAYIFKDGTYAVKGLSDRSYFLLGVEWDTLTLTEYNTLMDLYHNPVKANGMERTFPWINPVDGLRYTVRFMSEFTPGYSATGAIKVAGITLRVEGKYPV